MNQYELLYIVPAKLEEDARQAVVERVSKVITDNQGVIKDHNSWLTRKLSYPIKHIRQGIFMLAHFTIDGEKITRIKREFEIDEDILRVSIIQVDESKKTVSPRRSEKVLPQSVRDQSSSDDTKPQTAETASEEPADKVSLEELDKKLEELLSNESEVK